MANTAEQLNELTAGFDRVHGANQRHVAFGNRFSRLNDTPLDYKVFVSQPDQNLYVIADMPENFSWDVSAEYDTPYAAGVDIPGANITIGDTGASNDLVDLLKIFSGKRLTSQLLTTQVWQATSHMDFSIEMNFQAEYDSYGDVINPIETLMRMTLPSKFGPILNAPGPIPSINTSKLEDFGHRLAGGTPDIDVGTGATTASQHLRDIASESIEDGSVTGDIFSGVITVGEKVTQVVDGGIQGAEYYLSGLADVIDYRNRIILQLGNFMLFDSVVITSVPSDAQLRVDENGKPIFANVTVGFRTYQVPLSNHLDRIFLKRPGPDHASVQR